MKSNSVPVGVSTLLGITIAVLSGISAIVAGAEGNDTATVTGGAVATLAALTTIGGRMAQAIAIVKSAATAAGPWIDAAQDALREPPMPADPAVEIAYDDSQQT
jgi:hypothetical protein